MYLLLLALAPAILLMLYVYFRDKYEKEPIALILKGIALGAIIIFPVGVVENSLTRLGAGLAGIPKAAYDGFVVAALTEEIFKFGAVFMLVWRSRHFNEKFDGIVYAVSISLGFAAIENLFYVFSNHSTSVGILRAFTAVPGHTVFGIVMGFYMGLARFSTLSKSKYLLLAIVFPCLFHGFYDFLLLSGKPVLMLIFLPFLIIMYRFGLRKMREFNKQSVFNPANINFDNSSENQ
jgi:RsiW-degrading membrane proteinase PrsW (M82 family)